jgi:hypothetical protein
VKATLVAVSPEPPAADPTPVYRERLRTPWWWYLAAIGVALLLGAEFAVAVPRWWGWILLAVLIVMFTGSVWRLSSGEVVVTAREVRAGYRTVPVARVEAAIQLSRDELRRLVGRHGDPTAYVFIRSWIGPGVQLVLRPADSHPEWTAGPDVLEEWVPYCVLSSRRARRLIEALAAVAVPIR